jgi:paxillin
MGTCGYCNSSLGEEAVMALNRLWHPDHFMCAACKKPIRQTFQVISWWLISLIFLLYSITQNSYNCLGRQWFCLLCSLLFVEFQSKMCRFVCHMFAKNLWISGCNDALVDTCLLALEKHWHPRCFTCSLCGKPLPSGEYYLVDDKPYDLDCHWEKRLDKRTQELRECHHYD